MPRNTPIVRRSLWGAAIFLVAGCAAQQETPRTGDDVGGLPELVQSSHCIGEQAHADFCDLAGATDVWAVGRIKAFEWVYEPAIVLPIYQDTEEAELVSSQECLAREHKLTPELLITLEDTRYLSGDGPAELAVMAETGAWLPFPVPDGSGELPTGVAWVGPNPEKQLRIGQTLGVATLYYADPGQHFLNFMFMFDEEGMKTQKVNCAMEGLTEDGLAAEFSTCEPRNPDEQNDGNFRRWMHSVPSCSPPYTGE